MLQQWVSMQGNYADMAYEYTNYAKDVERKQKLKKYGYLKNSSRKLKTFHLHYLSKAVEASNGTLTVKQLRLMFILAFPDMKTISVGTVRDGLRNALNYRRKRVNLVNPAQRTPAHMKLRLYSLARMFESIQTDRIIIRSMRPVHSQTTSAISGGLQ